MTQTDTPAAFRKRLLAKFRYNGAYGTLYFKPSQGGEEAGTIAQGYRMILFEGKLWPRQRLVWIIEKEEWPPRRIYFLNKVKVDTRIANLTANPRDRAGVVASRPTGEQIGWAFWRMQQTAKRAGLLGYVDSLPTWQAIQFT